MSARGPGYGQPMPPQGGEFGPDGYAREDEPEPAPHVPPQHAQRPQQAPQHAPQGYAPVLPFPPPPAPSGSPWPPVVMVLVIAALPFVGCVTCTCGGIGAAAIMRNPPPPAATHAPAQCR